MTAKRSRTEPTLRYRIVALEQHLQEHAGDLSRLAEGQELCRRALDQMGERVKKLEQILTPQPGEIVAVPRPSWWQGVMRRLRRPKPIYRWAEPLACKCGGELVQRGGVLRCVKCPKEYRILELTP